MKSNPAPDLAYRDNLLKRKADLARFLQQVQAQIQQAVGELNKIEGKLEAYDELTAEKNSEERPYPEGSEGSQAQA